MEAEVDQLCQLAMVGEVDQLWQLAMVGEEQLVQLLVGIVGQGGEQVREEWFHWVDCRQLPPHFQLL